MSGARPDGPIAGSTGIRVRPARPEDLATAGELTANAYLADALITEDDDYVARLRATGDRATEATLLVAVDDTGEVLGTITLAHHGGEWADVARPGEAELRMLAVDPDHRGRGVGEALMRAGIERGLVDSERVVLSTMTAMAAAQRMYARIGLRRVPERDWWIGSERMMVYTT